MDVPYPNQDDVISGTLISKLAAIGWTIKARRVDKDPAKPILGFRLTNCRALYDKALSIQIFDRSTVSLSFGFSNDEHVSLTEDDGRDFLAWMRRLNLLPTEVWDALESPLPRAEQPEVINMAKARLVEYLVQSSPQIFGKYGTMSAGGDFYAELLALMKDPARDEDIARRMSHALEAVAHDFYALANAMLRNMNRQADEGNTGGSAMSMAEAYGMARAAKELRACAEEYRGRIHDDPPMESQFPEAIDPNTLAITASVLKTAPDDPAARLAREEETARAVCKWCNAGNPRTRSSISEAWVHTDTPVGRVVCGDSFKPFQVDDIVTVVDATHPHFRRMGMVVATSEAPGGGVIVRFPRDSDAEFRREQLMYLSSGTRRYPTT